MKSQALRVGPSALLASLALSALLITDSAAAGSPPSLFEVPATLRSAGSGAAPRATVRQRQARARLDLLTRPDGSPAAGVGDRVQLNLFSDASFVMTVTEVAHHVGRGMTWSGALDGIDLGSAVLALQDGALVGQVLLPGAVYRIGYAPDGTQVVEEIDPGALPPEAHPVVPPGSGVTNLDVEVGDEPPPDAASQIDVLVVYTAAARASAGGTAAMQAEIALAVASANQAYANTRLVQRLRLVFAGEVSITETNFNADLDALRTDPTVGWLRTVSRADLVTLITDHGPSAPFCGIGFLMTTNSTAFAADAFSVVERDCATSTLTFAHELGHNMGAAHDPYVAGSGPTLFAYSHGYVDLVGRFRTIMAYDDQCADSRVTCPRISFFSTPGLSQNGRPIGTASTSDNARTLGQTAGTVANFRQTSVSPLTLSTAVNQPSVAVGDTLSTSVSVSNPGRAAGAADFYLGILLPGGTAVFFTDLTIMPTGGWALGTITNVASYRPIATRVPLGSPFAASFPNFLSYRRAASDPTGGFAFFLLVVTAGALADGVLAPGEVLGASLSTFAFPQATGADVGACAVGACNP